MRIIAATCTNGGCPTIYAMDDDQNVVIQGYILTEGEESKLPSLPANERLITVPMSPLKDAVNYSNR